MENTTPSASDFLKKCWTTSCFGLHSQSGELTTKSAHKLVQAQATSMKNRNNCKKSQVRETFKVCYEIIEEKDPMMAEASL